MRSRVLVLGVFAWLSACTAMAPGIQFGKATPSSLEVDENDPAVPAAEILAITPRLVRQEKALRDQQVAEDISALIQPAQVYRLEAGDVLNIVVWDHPELSASMLRMFVCSFTLIWLGEMSFGRNRGDRERCIVRDNIWHGSWDFSDDAFRFTPSLWQTSPSKGSAFV